VNDDLNEYGDSLIATTGVHGADIASQRLDDLDRDALSDLLERRGEPCTSVDIGCGFGWQGLRFAMLGAGVHFYDLLDEPAIVRTLREDHHLPLVYTKGDVTTIQAASLPTRIDLGFSQRFIHYLEFETAVAMLRRFATRMPTASPFYMSASGINSELAEDYRDRDALLTERFALLSPSIRARHGISAPVCLYDEADLSTLMAGAGFVAVKVWSSPFGNVKGVFRKSD